MGGGTRFREVETKLSAPPLTLSGQKEWKDLVVQPTIETKQEVGTLPAGWEALVEGVPNQVAGETVVNVRPVQKGSRVPDEEEKQKAENN